MKTVLTAICAALLVILALGASLYALAGDWLGAGFFLLLSFATGVTLWLSNDYTDEEYKK